MFKISGVKTLKTELSLSDECKRDTSLYDRRRNQRVRKEVLNHYSNGKMICECCYEDNVEFLTIDHINGCGKELREKQGEGARLYHWIKRNNFPDGFRILCYNCNCSAKKLGICPHKLEMNEEW